ncbi:MAG: hypothetical protein KAS21_05675 [Candidatus Aminicenantes bacterium]|nr:hypothetical protein [Candidatus Aminicenantes bacterium]
MKRIIFMLIAISLLFTMPIKGEVVTSFPDLLKPTGLVIDNNNLYVTEDITIYIFSLKDFKLIKKFGKKGEGPQEFNRFAAITPLKDKLLINSMSKISYFTKDGEYINEIKVKGGFSFLYQPLGDKYVGRGISNKDNTRYVSINLYDKDLNKIKTLLNQEDGAQFSKGVIKVLNSSLNYMTFNDKLYLVNGSEFEIKVFDSSAKEIMTIKRDYKRAKFTEENVQSVHDEIKNDPRQKQFYDAIKKMLVFPKEWPAIASVFERDNIIYVSTFKSKDKTKYEFLLFDENGKFIHSMFIPLKFQTALRPYPMSIKNGKLYQLIENEDEEEWELHVSFIHNLNLTKFSEVTENVKTSSKLKHK